MDRRRLCILFTVHKLYSGFLFFERLGEYVECHVINFFMQNLAGEGKKDKGATEKNNNLPNNIRLRSSLLINLRPTAGIQVMAQHPLSSFKI